MLHLFRLLNWDLAGTVASGLCILHCLFLPLLGVSLTLFPAAWPSGPIRVDQAQDACDGCCSSEATALPGVEDGVLESAASCCSSGSDFWTHAALFAAVVPIALIAIGTGFARHRVAGVALLAATGVTLLGIALIAGPTTPGPAETMLSVPGGLTLVVAHLWNRRELRCCAPGRNCRHSQSGAPTRVSQP